MTVCAVADCRSDSRKDKNLSFHRFPKGNKTIRKIWNDFCKRRDTFNLDNSFLCSKHFVKKDFELNFKQELMNEKSKTKLVQGAIPTLRKEIVETERTRRMHKKEQAEMVKQLLETPSKITEIDNFKKIVTDNGKISSNDLSIEGKIDFKAKYEQTLLELNQSKELNKVQQDEITTLKLKCEEDTNLISYLQYSNNLLSQKLSFQINELEKRNQLILKVLKLKKKNHI